ncbi:MAG: hypothetical protein JNM56_32525 [Planctomycetia bacterium]|nr:hypothetical protein [Planctomycetia bacterium]
MSSKQRKAQAARPLYSTPRKFRVECQEEAHWLQFNKKGRLVRRSHTQDELRREREIQELGGDPVYACTEAVRLLESVLRSRFVSDIDRLPVELQKVAKRVKARRRYARDKTRPGIDLTSVPFIRRPEGVARLVNHLLTSRLHIRRGDFSPTMVKQADFGGYELHAESSKGIHKIPIDLLWLHVIYRQGVALLGGGLTLALYSAGAGVWIADQIVPCPLPGGGRFVFGRRQVRCTPTSEGWMMLP